MLAFPSAPLGIDNEILRQPRRTRLTQINPEAALQRENHP
jgi:hypothetical protein